MAAAANTSALVKTTTLMHASMTTFGQDFILDLIETSFFPQEDFAKLSRLFFLHLLFRIVQQF